MFDDFAGTQVGCVDLYEFDPKNHRVGLGILVDPAFRGKGFGKEAIQFIQSEVSKLSLKLLYLEVEPHNENAQKLYLAHDFELHNRKLMKYKVTK